MILLKRGEISTPVIGSYVICQPQDVILEVEPKATDVVPSALPVTNRDAEPTSSSSGNSSDNIRPVEVKGDYLQCHLSIPRIFF